MGCWFEDDDKRRIKLGQLFLNNLLRIKENNNIKALTVDIFGFLCLIFHLQRYKNGRHNHE